MTCHTIKIILFKEHVNNATFFKVFILFLIMCMLVCVHLYSYADRSKGLQISQKNGVIDGCVPHKCW